ncbi:MAG: PilW family protein [Pyrinomonadaceae bacterium]
MNKQNSNSNKLEEFQGFTLIELLIAMIVFTIATGIALAFAVSVRQQGNEVVQKTESTRGARVAMNYLRRDVINAGLGYHRVGALIPDNYGNNMLGMPADTDVDYDLLTALMAGDQRNVDNVSGETTDQVCFAMRDLSFNNGDSIAYDNVILSGSSVQLRFATKRAVPVNRYDVLLIETATSQILAQVTYKDSNSTIVKLDPGDPLRLNLSANGSGTNRSILATQTGKGTIKKVNFFCYSVTPQGVLTRRQFGNNANGNASNQIDTRELVSGVLNFQIRYLTSSGQVLDDPSNGNDGRTNQQQMNQVVQVEITITVSSLDDTGTNAEGEPYTLQETISTRNLRYDLG